jgi:hypothetical protein
LAAKLQGMDRKERLRVRKNLERRAKRAVATLERHGEAVTRRAVMQRLAKRGGCPIRKGKIVASKALRIRRAELLFGSEPRGRTP